MVRIAHSISITYARVPRFGPRKNSTAEKIQIFALGNSKGERWAKFAYIVSKQLA
jgi:hypothetical protein